MVKRPSYLPAQMQMACPLTLSMLSNKYMARLTENFWKAVISSNTMTGGAPMMAAAKCRRVLFISGMSQI